MGWGGSRRESFELIKQKALGRKHSEDVRKAMSENRKGEKGSFYGKNHTEENKAKLREIALNRTKFHKPAIEVEVLNLKKIKQYYTDLCERLQEL